MLDGISLVLADGLTAVTGPNGSGKTTLGKLLAGILKPCSGVVEIFGTDTRKMSLGEIGRRVGYLFQEPERQIFAPTVAEELSFVFEIHGLPGDEIEARVDAILERFDLSRLRDSFPFTLSRGEKQRLALAAVLINRPDYLILDEPTTGLDVKRKAELLGLVREMLDDGVGMLIISHDRSFVHRHASRGIEIVGGEIFSDLEL